MSGNIHDETTLEEAARYAVPDATLPFGARVPAFVDELHRYVRSCMARLRRGGFLTPEERTIFEACLSPAGVLEKMTTGTSGVEDIGELLNSVSELRSAMQDVLNPPKRPS